MANEAVIIELLGDGGNPVNFTVFDNEAIEKGTLMRLSGAGVRTATKSENAGAQTFAGIAAAEKVSGDGATTLACYTKGIFDLYHGGTSNIGDTVILSGVNTVCDGKVFMSGAAVGKMLEAGTNGGTMSVAVGVY